MRGVCAPSIGNGDAEIEPVGFGQESADDALNVVLFIKARETARIGAASLEGT
jgi:hypothetical protein